MSLLAFLALAAGVPIEDPQKAQPVIDMHMHAWSLSEFGGERVPVCIGAHGIDMHGVDAKEPFDFTKQASCKVMGSSPGTDAEVLAETLKEMKRFNIVLGVAQGDIDVVDAWRKADPARFIPAVNFFNGSGIPDAAHVATLEGLVREGRVKLFGEQTFQYRGLRPDDPRMEAFYAMAERLDVPVGIHMGYGAPGGPYWVYPNYRASLGNPMLLEDLLVKHPRLRVYVQHAGMPFTDEMIALLFSHPQVYVDISADNWGTERAEFHHHLKRLVEAGYGKRILFGSDQMVWPQTIEVAIDAITSASFLSEEQKRDILYNNAARFLRLSKEEIDRHHGRL